MFTIFAPSAAALGCVTLLESVKQDFVAIWAKDVYPCQHVLSRACQDGCKVEPLLILPLPIHHGHYPEVAEVFCQRFTTIIHLVLEFGPAAIVALIRGLKLVTETGIATGWIA